MPAAPHIQALCAQKMSSFPFTFQHPDLGGTIFTGGYKKMSVRAEAGMFHPVSMVQSGFFLPLPVSKPPDLGGVIVVSDGYKVLSVGAEAGMSHPASMRQGGFFLPLPVNKPPDLGGVIVK